MFIKTSFLLNNQPIVGHNVLTDLLLAYENFYEHLPGTNLYSLVIFFLLVFFLVSLFSLRFVC